ncbi:sugar phosphate exchanger 3-like [Convolutriloba macropyga]|uniref:sugar phosphate exchanger 3-like n=1 Tax=Convolutriloba macropyga TaxID=536237 RepID=UPI003F51B6B0
MEAYPLRIYSQLKTKFSAHHWINFSLSFFSVAAVTGAWKTLANVKPSLAQEWTELSQDDILPHDTWYGHDYFSSSSNADTYLGGLDFSFIIFNAVGLFIMGPLGDRLKNWRKLMLCVAMTLSVLATFFFGCLPDHIAFFNLFYLLCTWALNGLAQSPVIPLTLAMQANWFGKQRRGMVFGIWSASLSFGNIMSNLMCLWSLQYGYSYCFAVNTFILTAALIFVICGMSQTPEELGLEPVVEFDQKDIEDNDEHYIIQNTDDSRGYGDDVQTATEVEFTEEVCGRMNQEIHRAALSEHENSGLKEILTEEKIIERSVESCGPDEHHAMKKGCVLSPKSGELSDEQSDDDNLFEDNLDTDFSVVEEFDVNDARSEVLPGFGTQ